MKFYVYEHWRPDKDVCFYVGKGHGRRAQLLNRAKNKHHARIVKKLADLGMCVEVRLVAAGLLESDAYILEKNRIAFWLGVGISLTNKSAGGRGGMAGVTRSAESRAKQSKSMAGRKLSPEHAKKAADFNRSPERRAAVSLLHTGRKRPPETGLKISIGQKKSWADPEIKARRLATIPIPIFSEETRSKMRAAKTAEARAKISAAVKKQWENPEFRTLVSDTMRRTNAARKKIDA